MKGRTPSSPDVDVESLAKKKCIFDEPKSSPHVTEEGAFWYYKCTVAYCYEAGKHKDSLLHGYSCYCDTIGMGDLCSQYAVTYGFSLGCQNPVGVHTNTKISFTPNSVSYVTNKQWYNGCMEDIPKQRSLISLAASRLLVRK
jgi:hypothetical protein